MKKNIFKLLLLVLATLFYQSKTVFAQTAIKRNFSFHVFKPKPVKTNILSGSIITVENDSINTPIKANGLRIELIGLGILSPLVGRSPIAENDSEYIAIKKQYTGSKINGINISGSGSVLDIKINGISIGYVGQIVHRVNGISVVGMMNFVQEHNGIMAAIFFNQAYKMNGMQIGFANGNAYGRGMQLGLRLNESDNFRGLQISLFNVAKNLKGIQVGLWNVNQKRKLPLINWNFKS